MLPIVFTLSAGNSKNGNTFFNFAESQNLTDHIYSTGNIIDSLRLNFIGLPGLEYLDFNMPGASPRYIQITELDTVKKIISGVFAFTLYAKDGPGTQHMDSVVVTEGRFDLQIGQFADCSQ